MSSLFSLGNAVSSDWPQVEAAVSANRSTRTKAQMTSKLVDSTLAFSESKRRWESYSRPSMPAKVTELELQALMVDRPFSGRGAEC